jgi:hypothetical protein
MEKESTQLTTGFTIEELEAAYYLSMSVPVKKVEKATGVSQSRLNELLKIERFKSEIASARVAAVTRQNAMRDVIQDLAQTKLFDILAQDYDKVGEAERREIARTARFAASLETPDHGMSSVVNNNLIVAEDGLQVLAKHIARLQDGYVDPDEIAKEYSISSVASTYSCAPGTTHGLANYDSESGEYQCHICGHWYAEFEEHVEEHGLSYESYKGIFGLNG